MCSVVDGYRPAFRTLVTRAAPSTPNGSRKVEASASDQALAQAISNDLAIGLPLEDLADMSREEAFETYKESQVCYCSLSEGEGEVLTFIVRPLPSHLLPLLPPPRSYRLVCERDDARPV